MRKPSNVRSAETIAEIRNDPDVYVPFKPVPEVQPWLDAFRKKGSSLPSTAHPRCISVRENIMGGVLTQKPLEVIGGKPDAFP